MIREWFRRLLVRMRLIKPKQGPPTKEDIIEAIKQAEKKYKI